MRNKYAGVCLKCNTYVSVGAGFFERQVHGSVCAWRVRCPDCTKYGEHRREVREHITKTQKEYAERKNK